jgi:murein L,D-transpeptidase YafK
MKTGPGPVAIAWMSALLALAMAATATGGETVASVLGKTQAKGLGLTETEREGLVSLTLVALKEERLLEVWANRAEGPPRRIRSYPFTASSGGPGPKLREGDGQIPEGIYRIESLNPNSRYHLSIKLDYPNAFDRARGEEDGREKLGFDIFIHGKAVTIGCIPIGDEAIEDLFTLVAEVGVKKVKAILAPCDFRAGAEAPAIDGIGWEGDLYELLREAMRPYVMPELRPVAPKPSAPPE